MEINIALSSILPIKRKLIVRFQILMTMNEFIRQTTQTTNSFDPAFEQVMTQQHQLT